MKEKYELKTRCNYKFTKRNKIDILCGVIIC